jgi:polysaccharide biosynthesis protein PslH
MATILTIIPYSFYPPISGGAHRCFYILREMARYNTVYVLTCQPESDFSKNATPKFPVNVNIISTYNKEQFTSPFNIFPSRIANALNSRLLTNSINEPTNTYLLECLPTLKDILNRVDFDIIYYESLEAFGIIRRFIKSKNIIKIYDAHNCDSELWSQQALINSGDVKFKKYASKALSLENSLYKHIDAFFCCSDVDFKKIMKLNENKLVGVVIPNGVDLVHRPYDQNPDKSKILNLIFCGSLNYFPNQQGLLWFYDEVFPLVKEVIPNINLTVVGNTTSMVGYQELINDSSVNFIGKVKSVVPYYLQSSVAIIPLLSGSGTRLKILEAMSMGNPIVSTSIGAAGINLNNGEHLLIADTPQDFARQILSLQTDEKMFHTIRQNSLKIVEYMYDWNKIGIKMNSYIKNLLIKRIKLD